MPPRSAVLTPAAAPAPGPRPEAGLPSPVTVADAERDALLEVARAALAVATGTAPGSLLEGRSDRGHDRGRLSRHAHRDDGAARCMGALDVGACARGGGARRHAGGDSDPRFRRRRRRAGASRRGVGPRPLLPLERPEASTGVDGVVSSAATEGPAAAGGGHARPRPVEMLRPPCKTGLPPRPGATPAPASTPSTRFGGPGCPHDRRDGDGGGRDGADHPPVSASPSTGTRACRAAARPGRADCPG
jgi:hypothetical protein